MEEREEGKESFGIIITPYAVLNFATMRSEWL